MGFSATVRCQLCRELTAPAEQGQKVEVQKEDYSGIFEGSVSVQNGIVHVRYEGPDGMRCAVSFAKTDPDIITLNQKYGEDTDTLTLVIEEGRRHISINRTHGEQLEITSLGFRVRNSIQKNGKLLLSYATELHGFRVEKTHLCLEMHKINNIK